MPKPLVITRPNIATLRINHNCGHIRCGVEYVFNSFAFLIPRTTREITGAELADLVADYYDTDNPRIAAGIEILKTGDCQIGIET